MLLTYWNTVAFHALYARTAGWSPSDPAPAGRGAGRSSTDGSSRGPTGLVSDVTTAWSGFDTQRTGALLSQFVDDLSNWYVRRSRRRFWEGDPAALATLHETLDVLTRLMAPLMPFVTERVWQDLFRAADPDAAPSVHLASWPSPTRPSSMKGLDDQVALARRIVELGRAARAEAKVRTRQPLRRALVPSRALGPAR